MRGKALLVIAVVCSLMALGATKAMANGDIWVDPRFAEGFNGEEMVLDPSTAAYCNKHFAIQNMSDNEIARVRIARGNGSSYEWNALAPHETRQYENLTVSIYTLGPMQNGGTEPGTQIANATVGKAKVKVLCQ